MIQFFHFSLFIVNFLLSYATSVVMNAFSSGDAKIFTPTCWLPAKMSPSPIPDETSLLCSASDNHKSSFNALIEVVDCLRST